MLCGTSDSDDEAFDPVELLRYANDYGHPEEWIKKAQQLHAENERLRERASSSCEVCGHPAADRHGALIECLRILRVSADFHQRNIIDKYMRIG